MVAQSTITMQKPSAAPANGEHQPHDEDPAADSFVHDASTQVTPQMHMNGTLPPQQVYVESMGPNKIAGLETQFQTLGIHGEDGNTHDNRQDDDDVEDEDDEGGEGEDDPLKLFVGQVR
jgi:hypothetical protein